MTDPQITAVDVAAWLDAARDEDLIELEACMSLTDRAQQVIALRRASRPDPQTAADAAERVQAWIDKCDRVAEAEGGWAYVFGPEDTVFADALRELLAERKRMAAELEQVRGDWLTQAAQLNRIAGMVGHALILRAYDDATPEKVRLALARACEDVHGVIGESEATRAQRTERYLVMCANLLNDHVLREHDGLAERGEEMRDALDVARAELAAIHDQGAIDLVAVVAMLDGVDHYRVWLADAYDPDVPAPDPATAIYRRAHELRACFAGRLFAAGYDPEAPGVTATRPAGGSDAEGAGKGPESHGDPDEDSDFELAQPAPELVELFRRPRVTPPADEATS